MANDEKSTIARRLVRSAPAPGFNYVVRAGRFWPAKGAHVEILDQAEDEPSEGRDGTSPGAAIRIGRVTLAALEGDTRISFGIAESLADVVALKERVAELEAENAALKAASESKPEGKAAKK